MGSDLVKIFIDPLFCVTDNPYDEDDDEITPDLWQEACWIVIRSVRLGLCCCQRSLIESSGAHSRFDLLLKRTSVPD